MFAQALACGVDGEEPVFKLEREVGLRKFGRPGLEAALHEQFFGRHRGESLVDIVGRAFRGEKLAGADIEKSHSARGLAEMHGGKKVVFAPRQHVVVHCHAGRHKLCYAAFHELFGELGVFELLAYGHALSGADELGQVAVEGVMGETGKLDVLGRAVGAAGEGYAQYFGGLDGIVGEGFVKVADAEQQYGVGMFCLHLGVLLHKRCFCNLLCHSGLFIPLFGQACLAHGYGDGGENL